MNIETANRLMKLRKEHNLSQEELADKIGVSRQAISNWERGEASPDTDNLILLAQIYEITIDEILTGKVPQYTSAPDVTSSFQNTEHQTYTEPIIEEKTIYEEPPKTNISSIWAVFPYPILCAIFYLIIGFFFNLWHPGWLIFLTIPLYYSLIPIMKMNEKQDHNKWK